MKSDTKALESSFRFGTDVDQSIGNFLNTIGTTQQFLFRFKTHTYRRPIFDRFGSINGVNHNVGV